MPHVFPPFRPEKYPRTYKLALEGTMLMYVYATICAMVTTPMFVVQAVKHGGLNMNFLLSQDFLSIMGPVFSIFLVICQQSRLTLTADSISYRDFLTWFLPCTMKRADIKGLRIVYYSAGKGGGWQTVFLPRDETRKALIVPQSFKLDDDYDAWVGDLPFLEGKYDCSNNDLKDPARVSWNAYHHCWLPSSWR